ncbi:MAG: YhjD/YihY/BrkB family envelope integrity protein [Planctomycetota bacterium]|jgi:membrane protein
MIRKRLQMLLDGLARAITSPREELTRWQRAARYTYDLFRYGARQLQQDKAPQMAGALAYRTLFGLIPVLAVTTVLVRALGGFDQLEDRVSVLFTEWGLDKVSITGDEPADQEVVDAAVAQGETLSQWLLGLLDEVEKINFAAIGGVGVALLIYSAIGLMATIENGFNTICRAPQGRSWTRRVPMYWTVLTLGPAAIALMVYVNGVMASLIDLLPAWHWLLSAANYVWGFCVIWLVIGLIYRLVPSTSMPLRTTLLGAFITAILLEILRRSLGAYVQNMRSLSALYGSLGLIPLFMFWVYIVWFVILFGLQVSATLQRLGGRRPEAFEPSAEFTGLIDPAAVVLVMKLIASDFADGRPTTAAAISEHTNTPESTVVRMLAELIKAGYVHRLEHEGGAVTLARPPEHIPADRLMEIGFGMVQSGGGGTPSPFIEQLHAAQRALASRLTLATLPG